MKKFVSFLIALMMPLFIFGQSYNSLWKKVSEAQEKDLPKTAYDVLQKIVKKAAKDKAYGQLLKAELLSAQAMVEISPDSLEPAVAEIRKHYEAASDEVLKTVYQTVLHRIDVMNYSISIDIKAPRLTPALCETLGSVKDETYKPFVVGGVDAAIFNNDMLSVIGYEIDSDFEEMHAYYEKVGNRRAACITAARLYRYASVDKIDAAIRQYEDLQEAGELAIVRYDKFAYDAKAERLAYIREALSKWGRWSRMDYLRNEEQRLTNPQYSVAYSKQVVLPQQSQQVRLMEIRNLSSLTMKVYRVNVNGDFDASPNYQKGYDELKPYIGEVVYSQTHEYTGREPYAFYEDSLDLQGLPVGVYMVEFKSEPSTSVVRQMYYVTDVYTLAEAQPSKEGIRYVVVNATTGQPVAGAHLRIREYIPYGDPKETDAVTDGQGEYFFRNGGVGNRRKVFAYTDTDKACPPLNESGRYDFSTYNDYEQLTNIYTDRAIYRPGQTVHVSALKYEVRNGMEQAVSEKNTVHFIIRDANYEVIHDVNTTTDEYGVATIDFTLPASGLTGNYTIEADGERHTIRVEEYKRPTFHVDFPEVKEAYAAGDELTVKGSAMSFAGVPVQGAKVSYKVVRRTAYWWWSYSRYWNTTRIGYGSDGVEVYNGTAETADDGSFAVKMPLTMPETNYAMFYNFVVTADVTDTAGETHSGQLSLPLGNRKQTLQIEMADKVLLDDQPTATFHLLNAAGKDLDAKVSYRIDDGAWQTAATNTALSIAGQRLPSGAHTLEAVCEGDTATHRFVLFSLHDERPVTKTDDWFYLSAQQFPNDGKPVYLQIGSSDEDVHILYSVFAGKKVIKRGAYDRSNQLVRLELTYEEAYGNGLLLTFAWVKNGKCHTHQAEIQRPLPDKKLRLEWTTFRDRLQPGQQEEWTLSVKDPEGRPVDAQLMATLYDKSLDMLVKHQWSLSPYVYLPLPGTSWNYSQARSMSAMASRNWRSTDVHTLTFSHFDGDVFPLANRHSFRRFSRGAVYESDMMILEEPRMLEKTVMLDTKMAVDESAPQNSAAESDAPAEEVQLRENLNETAFFYPQLTTDANGHIALKFTLPESLTTWRLMGLAHTKDLYYGSIEGETVAQKDVMIQPNVPRFLRDGDKGQITARIFNTSKKNLTGKATLKLIDPETDAIVFEQSQPVSLKADGTAAATFSYTPDDAHSLLVCQMTVSGKGFSDGEQQYLPILPSTEHVTVTLPITQHHPGTAKVDLGALIPADATNGRLTFEYTNNPAWLMIQALPTVGSPSVYNAISLGAAFYANALGRHILNLNPKAASVFKMWKNEADQASLTSALEKNQELKDIVLNETPWVMDANRENTQKQRLADFFDQNLMQSRLDETVKRLGKLQCSDGSWAWFEHMQGSFYMTVAVSEMLVRLNAMAGEQADTREMLNGAFRFMGHEMVVLVDDIKKRAKETGIEPTFPSFSALEWLYLTTLDGRELPSDVQTANDYLLRLLKKEIKSQSIYEKALTAVILSKYDAKRALEYVQSLKEYTVFKEETGRYYDTPRAGYSWYDYKIPTQTMAIEALERLTPDDRQTIEEMQRWLLQEKRTQAWDTPINSVNAVYAFLQGGSLELNAQQSAVKVDQKPLELPKATAAIGYVKTELPAKGHELAVEKTSDGTSWGAVYAQFQQATKRIADSGSGLTIKREILAPENTATANPSLKVGDRIRVRITIQAERDYDFVQVLDKRAACLEPVRQLSGWHDGSYCTPKDYTTNYYFDCLSKGKHVIENEYFIDRAGTYETGTCTVQCAYAPEFRATTKSETLNIKK